MTQRIAELETSCEELLEFARHAQVIYKEKIGLLRKGLFELVYHLDDEHPESVEQMIKRAEKALNIS